MRGPTFALALMLFALGSFAAIAPARPVDAPKFREQGQPAQKAAPRPTIVFQGNLLSVRARNVPWETVVKEIERQTGILIRIDGRLAGTLTLEFEALPLEQGLRRLFRHANLLFFYVAPRGVLEARLMRVWLLPKEGGAGEEKPIHASSAVAATEQREEGSAMGEPVAEEDNQEERLTKLHALAWQDDVGALQQAVFDPYQTTQETALELLAERDQPEAIALLLSATKSDQPERRFQALNLLHQTGHADERTILSALSEALSDEDINVKSYAIQALAVRGVPDALEPLRQVLRDPDPSVRMMVIENVAPKDEGLTLLREALSDDDETLRSAPASKLEEAVSATE